ncbi:MAG: tripartite tricarboxylate transporter substrate binding protein [Alphaproteobacteria bacterium]|nr:tripartite tricarboxylate transporter substrate binding protein [Alphaproteobacteria bacterium]
MLRTLFAILAFVLLGAPVPATAQDAFPSRNVRLVVSFPPGGGIDAVARMFAEKLAGLLGQPVVVENRGGASGTIAGKAVAGAEPDGYTVLVASNSMLIAQALNPKIGLDTPKELLALASAAPQAVIVVAQPDLAANSLKELAALAKTRRLNYGSPGAGSIGHLAGEYLFSTASGVSLEHIPFPGAAQALTAVLGKQTDLAVVTLPPTVSLVQSGKLKGIAVTTEQRSAALPQVQNVVEAGVSGFSASAWTGFFVPAKTPKAVADKLGDAIVKVAAMPDVKERLSKLGFEPTSVAGARFQREIGDELKRWSAVIDKAGLRK